MRTWSVTIGMLVMVALAADATDGRPKIWTFEHDTPGSTPTGFTGAVGEWTVVNADGGRVLAQATKNANTVFNIALVDDTSAKDLDVSVKLKALAGELDQGGGLVWRAKDAKNYYVARFNHLEDNFRVYKVVDGVRSQPFQNADVKHHDGWTVVRVTMKRDHIECYLDGKKYLDVKDATFADAGRIGVWSKADARSQFDDLTLTEP